MSEVNVDLKEEKPSLSEEEKAAFIEASRSTRPSNDPSKNAGFSIPTDFVKLPSGGKVYPVGSALHNVRELEVRYLTAADEDILTSRSLLRNGTALDRVLENCLIDKNIKAEELISGDKNSLITFKRFSCHSTVLFSRGSSRDCSDVFSVLFERFNGCISSNLGFTCVAMN